MKALVKRLGFFICLNGVLIITLLSSKNCTKLSNVAIAIIVARGEIMELKESGDFIKEYDSNNNLIHVERISCIFEAWYEYDDKNRKIHYKNSSSEESWYEYYDNGKLKSARYKAPNSEVIYQYDYDENGVLKRLHQAQIKQWVIIGGIRGQQWRKEKRWVSTVESVITFL